MSDAAILEKIETLNQAVARLQERVEDLEDLRDLESSNRRKRWQTADSLGASQSRTRARLTVHRKFLGTSIGHSPRPGSCQLP